LLIVFSLPVWPEVFPKQERSVPEVTFREVLHIQLLASQFLKISQNETRKKASLWERGAYVIDFLEVVGTSEDIFVLSV